MKLAVPRLPGVASAEPPAASPGVKDLVLPDGRVYRTRLCVILDAGYRGTEVFDGTPFEFEAGPARLLHLLTETGLDLLGGLHRPPVRCAPPPMTNHPNSKSAAMSAERSPFANS